MMQALSPESFLTHDSIAVVGASDDPKNFGRTVYTELRAHGYDVVPVNWAQCRVAGDRCYPDLASIPGHVQGVIVMVRAEHARAVVDECITLGIRRVWLFKGLGGEGAVSLDAIETAEANGIELVVGACPLMFLEPMGWPHRVHRWFHNRHPKH